MVKPDAVQHCPEIRHIHVLNLVDGWQAVVADVPHLSANWLSLVRRDLDEPGISHQGVHAIMRHGDRMADKRLPLKEVMPAVAAF